MDKFNGLTSQTFPPAGPATFPQHFRTRPMKVVTLNDKSDTVLRFDLFEPLNTGGITLTAQEIRDCVYQGPFAEMLDELSSTKDFRTVVKLTSKQKNDGTAAEGVLRFFAFLDRYRDFEHSVKEFLNGYMKDASNVFNVEVRRIEFLTVFRELARAFPKGVTRSPNKNRTPLNLFEGVAVGAALALKKNDHLITQDLAKWMASNELKKFTTAATNDRINVRGRVELAGTGFWGSRMFPPIKTEIETRFSTVEEFFRATKLFRGDLGAAAKGIAFVQVYASYEYTVRSVVQTAIDEINMHGTKFKDIAPSLMALYLDPELSSVRTSAKRPGGRAG